MWKILPFSISIDIKKINKNCNPKRRFDITNKKILVMIPARYNSEEIFCKTIADIAGKPMIQHVYERVQNANNIKKVIIATDHEKIANVVREFGGDAIITSKSHICGSDRIVEAYSSMNEKYDVIVNVQADEPFVISSMIDEVTQPLLDDDTIPMSTLC